MAKLYFTYAAMNAGKSTVLLQSAFNYEERGMRTLLFTAAIDDRVEIGVISSRIGLQEKAFLFDENTDMAKVIEKEHRHKKISCVFVDEAQFLSKHHVIQLTKTVDKLGLPVMCYGLRTDFQGRLFEGSQWLLALADVLKEMKTICHCGRKATMNLRIDENGNAVQSGESIEIGGAERYVSLCRGHFFEKVNPDTV